EQNRHTNPVKFFNSAGNLIYEKPLQRSNLEYAKRNDTLGKGYYAGDVFINEPFNFSKKNRFSLADLHAILRSVFFPEAVTKKQRFNITDEDRKFIQKYMSMLPGESKFPSYAPPEYWDEYVKVLLYGTEKNITDPNIRIFNKEGDAYGFLIDAAYIVDFKNNIEFMLSAVIHCNSDGIYNDDKYDYDSVGYPFMKHLGQIIYDYELKRERKYKPDLSALHFNYNE
ncbi:MAG: hypothetical protein M3O67_07300, partial [Bacteroidota bacterium]|nr:hypothetical protein [Bacteroidota bacterium]